MEMTTEVPGVKLEEVAVTRDEAMFSVTVDGAKLGNVSFVKYYEPVLQTIGPYVALWTGPTLCVIDRRGGTMRCIEREDETYRLHPFEHDSREGSCSTGSVPKRCGGMSAMNNPIDLNQLYVVDALVYAITFDSVSQAATITI